MTTTKIRAAEEKEKPTTTTTREKMRRSEMRAFNPATVKDELVLLFLLLLLCLFLKYSPSVGDRPSVAINKE